MSTKQVEKLEATLDIPEGVKVTLNKSILKVEGPLGKALKNFKKIPVNLAVNENKIELKAIGSRKKDYAILNTAKSIIRNLCEGVVEGYTVKTQGNLVLIENFQGERAPRTSNIHGATKVVAKGDVITLTGPVLTDVTQSAAEIEQKTKIKNKDHRVFLDGIYISSKSKGIEK